MPASVGPHKPSGICQCETMTEAKFCSVVVIMFTSPKNTIELKKAKESGT